jgi:hypothetical protein
MDGNGVIEANLKLIKAKIFPLDEMTHDEAINYSYELVQSGLLLCFEYKNKRYFLCPTFKKHQKIYSDDKKLEIPENFLEMALNEASREREETSRFQASPSSSSSTSSSALSPVFEKKPDSNILDFENSFNAQRKGFEEIILKLFDEFDSAVPRNVRQAIGKIVTHFVEPEKLRNWCNEIIGNEKKMKDVDTPARFLATCILREVGAIQ